MLNIITFTKKGEKLAGHIMSMLSDEDTRHIDGRAVKGEELMSDIGSMFAAREQILFISATGIAVRKIAPFVKDKLTDSPVLCMDDTARFVIPLLSGHMGGANAFANKLAELTGATPVITTATDNAGIFAIDIFAREHKLAIVNREGIAKVSAGLLDGKALQVIMDVDEELCRKLETELRAGIGEDKLNIITVNEANIKAIKEKNDGEINYDTMIAAENDAIIESVDRARYVSVLITYEADKSWADLILTPGRYVVGMGCKAGKSFDELKGFLSELLVEKGISEKSLVALCSIDAKSKERGLIELATELGIPFITYTVEELISLEGRFNDSDFVKDTVGVGNVCERSVAFYMKNAGKIVVQKVSKDGMTCAIGKIDE